MKKTLEQLLQEIPLSLPFPRTDLEYLAYFGFDESFVTDLSGNYPSVAYGTGVRIDDELTGKPVINYPTPSKFTNLPSTLQFEDKNITFSIWCSFETDSLLAFPIWRNSGTGEYWYFRKLSSSSIRYLLNDTTSSFIVQDDVTSLPLVAKKMQMHTFVFNRDTAKARYYLDGEFIQENDITNPSGDITNNGPFNIGSANASASEYVNVANITVYKGDNAALTDEQVKQLFEYQRRFLLGVNPKI